MSFHNSPKEGDIFHHDRVAQRNRSLHALTIAKKREQERLPVPVRINARTVIMVDANEDIDRAVYQFKKKHNL